MTMDHLPQFLSKFYQTRTIVFILVLSALGNINAQSPNQDNYSELKKESKAVDSILAIGQTKTAGEMALKLKNKSIALKHAGYYFKSLCQLIYTQDFDNDTIHLELLNSEIANTSGEFKALACLVYAKWLSSKYSRWRDEEKIYDDHSLLVSDWDPNTIKAKVNDYILMALVNADGIAFKEEFRVLDLMEAHDQKFNFNVSLKAMIAKQAIEIVEGIKDISNEQEAFDTVALYADRMAFMQMDLLKSNYPDDLKKRIYLFQILAKENQMLLELDRLTDFRSEYPCNAYIHALDRLFDEYKHQEQCVFVIKEQSNYYYNENKVKALALVNNGIEMYKNSRYINLLYSERDRLLEHSISIYTENVYPIKKDRRVAGTKILMKVEQSNCDSLNFYIIKIQPIQYYKLKRQYEAYDYNNNRKWIGELLKTFPIVYSGSRRFEHTGDLNSHSYDVALPGLGEGSYLIVTSDSTLNNQSSLLSINEIKVADFLLQNEIMDSKFRLISALNGQALANEKFNCYKYTDDDELSFIFSSKTNKKGEYVFPKASSEVDRYVLEFKKGAIIYNYQENYYYGNYEYDNSIKDGAILLTDRSIYRPGQEVQFKGIVYKEKTKQTVKDTEVTLQFFSNGLEIGDYKLMTNEYGSVSGKFKLPETAENNLVINLIHGNDLLTSIEVKVEEYKRPNFEIELKSPEVAYKLNQQVKVGGEAKTYSGIPVSNAGVKYTVRRYQAMLYHALPYDSYSESYSYPVQIVSGTALTDESGRFDLEFYLKAPENSDKGSLRYSSYIYKVQVSITDINGEVITSEMNLMAGYSEQFAEISSVKYLNSDKENITLMYAVTNSAEKKLPFNGTIQVFEWVNGYSLKKQVLWEPSEFSALSAVDKEDLSDYQLETPKEQLILKVNKVYLNDTLGLIELESKNFKNPGKYKVLMKHVVAPGDTVTAESVFEIFPTRNFDSERHQILSVHLINGESFSPGDKAKFVVRTASTDKSIYITVKSFRGVIFNQCLQLKKGFKVLEVPVREMDRGGIQISVFTIDQHRLITANERISVPFSNKELKIELQTIRRRTEPGSHEKIVLKLSGPASEQAAKELCAVLYDASLDDIYSNSNWMHQLYYDFYSYDIPDIEQASTYGQNLIAESRGYSWFNIDYPHIDFSYYVGRMVNYWFYDEAYYHTYTRSGNKLEETMEKVNYDVAPAAAPAEMVNEPASQPVHLRKNFNETAFFMPQLYPNSNGEIVLEFDMPETIGKWRFMALAHSTTMQTGYIEDYIQTLKKLIVQPNLPRFIRQKDKVVLSAKVQNETDTVQMVTVRIRLSDAGNGTTFNWMGADSMKTVKIAPRSNVSVAFTLNVPDFTGMVSCAFIAASVAHSDAEMHLLPVLSNRTLVKTSMPISIREAGKQNLEFKALLSNSSNTLVTHQFSIDMCNRPAWYAVMSLPYLMESNEKSSDQVFSRFYAYSIAAYLAQKDKNVRTVYDQWKAKGNIKSKLNINEDLKSVLLSETPWVLEAKSDEERMNRLGELFDDGNMQERISDDFNLLTMLQGNSGGFAWYKGMSDNQYITENIVIGFGKLKQLGMDVSPYMTLVKKAIQFLDNDMMNQFRRFNKNSEFASREYTHYIYCKSFFPEIGLSMKDSVMIRIVSSSEKYWNSLNLYSKAHLAMAIKRYKPESNVPDLILRVFNENARRDKTLGMYWVNNWTYWQWDQSNIETHTAIMEVYSTLSKDSSALSDLQVWLLRNKQTNSWNSSVSTADACYALLSTGNWLGNQQSVSVTINGKRVQPKETEAGTGYWRADIPAAEVTPQTGKICVEATTSDLAYGGIYWQYFEDMDKVKTNSAGMSIQRKYYVERIVNGLMVKQEVKSGDTLKVGDMVTVVLFIQVDRNMEYVHIKDMRASTAEVTEALGTYKYQMGLGYYQNPNDVAMNFYIDYLNSGKYQLSYKVSLQQSGIFDCGIASIENLYAPEFSANSYGFKLFVAP